jgi:peptidoglycan/LPS O-acetylase OafA/YrhL
MNKLQCDNNDMPNNPLCHRGGGRIVGLDLLRFLLALLILMFHSSMHFGCSYGYLTPFVGMGAIAMTAFFMLSGYALYITYFQKNLIKIAEIKRFALKRFIGVFPLYYFVALVYIVFLGKESVAENLLLAPLELCGLQSILTGTFSISHNGGTWFISCIVICYMVYPYLQSLVLQMNDRTRIVLLVIAVAVMLYLPFVQKQFSLANIYPNAFVRSVEFSIGVLLASLNHRRTWQRLHFLQTWTGAIAGGVLLLLGVNALLYFHGYDSYMMYNWVALPAFMLIILAMGSVSFNLNSTCLRIIRYLSAVSYAIFLAQFFVWPLCQFVYNRTHIDSNLYRLMLTGVACLAISVFLHECIEKPATSYLKKKLL